MNESQQIRLEAARIMGARMPETTVHNFIDTVLRLATAIETGTDPATVPRARNDISEALRS